MKNEELKMVMMKKIILFTLLLLCALSLFSQRQNENRKLTDAEKIVGLSTCWSAAKYNFVYFDKLSFDWDSLYQATIPVILATKNDFEYYRELQRFVATLKDGHTNVSFPDNSEIWSNWATIPISTRLIDGKVIVTNVANDTLEQQGIKRGIELIKINGMDVHEYVSRYIKPYIFSSTEQWLNLQAYGRDLTRAKKTEKILLTFKDNKNKTFDCSVSPSMSANENFKQNSMFYFKVIEGNIGHLRITSFMGNKQYVEQFDSIYKLLTNLDGLIIDIRGNGGGNTNYSTYILSHLTNKKFKMLDWSSPMYIPTHASWNFPKEWYSQKSSSYTPVKNKLIFEKPVVLLVNEGTFSAAEEFCVGFRTMERGPIIGTSTGGSTGNPIPIELPGEGWVQLCTRKDTYPDGTEFVGVGILPDIEVKETVSSFLSITPDSDNSMAKEKAIQILKEKISKK